MIYFGAYSCSALRHISFAFNDIAIFQNFVNLRFVLVFESPLSVKSSNLIELLRISAIGTKPRPDEVVLSVKVVVRLICNTW